VKTLTLTQPWATLVAIGAKRIETRSWGTNYRGPVAIHAAKGFPEWAQTACLDEPFFTALTAGRGTSNALDLPRGVVVATCRLVAVHPVASANLRPWAAEHEFEFGDYSVGRYAWLLDEVEPLPEPVPARGALGLWYWDENIPSGMATP
jgi:hypothetical protein